MGFPEKKIESSSKALDYTDQFVFPLNIRSLVLCFGFVQGLIYSDPCLYIMPLENT